MRQVAEATGLPRGFFTEDYSLLEEARVHRERGAVLAEDLGAENLEGIARAIGEAMDAVSSDLKHEIRKRVKGLPAPKEDDGETNEKNP